MASLLAALSAYRPRLVARRTIGPEELAERLAREAGVSTDAALRLLRELGAEIRAALEEGDAVSLPGLARFRLAVRLDGRVRPVLGADPGLRRELRSLDDYRGEVRHRENVGLALEEVVALWNEAHPEDPVALPGEDCAD